MLSITPIPALNDNYIWHLTNGDEHWIVDPGEAAPVVQALQGASLDGILITHHHFDHTGGIAELHKRYQCPVFGPNSVREVTNTIGEGDSIQVLGTPIRVWSIPGHTLDHLALILSEQETDGNTQIHLFCGDTLFAAGCGRLFEGSPEQMFHSLQRLSALPPTTRVYCAHEYTVGNLNFARTIEPDNSAITQRLQDCQALRAAGKPTLPSDIAEEQATNPFLRCHITEVMQSGARHLGRENPKGLNEVEVFSSLRDLKDHF
ncbi:hydroxyacylglutathione hydrolase [Microbulbifer sp. GL-2]|uniref:hydroxyacylglutathione hydrolase n=1 Tax=Microbulbifer sp. GL-2 TaxID=2591606 RepID=UPI0011625BEE|nr:hydroxyacylglutathione hydrolase [Microbulbifer sp. GL-2]BBM02865.1 hydroxyacylglutathione hydrolase [Microbulbifer sp. GL-2]